MLSSSSSSTKHVTDIQTTAVKVPNAGINSYVAIGKESVGYRYNGHSAGTLDRPFQMLKYEYIFQIKYTEAIFSNSTRKLAYGYGLKTLWFEISNYQNADCSLKINLLCHLL